MDTTNALEGVAAAGLWIDRWRQDFSWAALKLRPWPGWSVDENDRIVETGSGHFLSKGGGNDRAPIKRAASLQDYWRVDLNTGRLRTDRQLDDELVERQCEPTFHRVHLPLRYSSGAPTGKHEWEADALDELLVPRLSIGAETPGAYRFKYGPSGWYALGPDRRTQLVGAVLLKAAVSTEETTHINARDAVFCRDALYDATRFGTGTEFAGAAFLREARFHRVTFEGDTRFTSAMFHQGADFEGAVFVGEASFFRTKFLGNASFRSGQFRDTVWFTAAAMTNVEFRARDFLGIAYFDGATFAGQFDFVCTNFAKLASFEEVTWPLAPRDWHGAFDHAMFHSPVSFRRSGFKALASFAGAIFERGVQIDHLDESASNAVFEAELAAIPYAAAQDAVDAFEIEARRAHVRATDLSSANFMAHTEGQARWIDLTTLREAAPNVEMPTPTVHDLERRRGAFRQLRLKELEAGCRTLKQAMTMASDTAREQMLYRFELIARRTQDATSLSEKALSVVYGILSDYGSSIVRPIVAWLAAVVMFALGYWAWSMSLFTPARVSDRDFAQALDVSWMNAARPFSALSDEAAATNGVAKVIFEYGQWNALWARLVGTAESMLSIALLFLLALAIRRRFQMN